jgi:uncharacterized integral membrane protein
MLILIVIYLFTAVGLTRGGSSTVHIYAQAIHRITQLTTLVGRLNILKIYSTSFQYLPLGVARIIVSASD